MRTGSCLNANPERSLVYRLVVSRIRISLKFGCRLFLEYQFDETSVKSREIKIDPKEKYYDLDEEVKWTKKGNSEDSTLSVYVRLLSSKGVSFTAGILQLSPKEPTSFNKTFKVPLTKALDPESYCECKFLTISSNFKEILEPEGSLHNSSLVSFKGRSESLSNQQLRNRVKELQLEVQRTRTSYDILKMQRNEVTGPIDKNPRQSFLQLSWNHLQQSEPRGKEKDFLKQIEKLDSELLKSNLTIERQKEVITILEASQRSTNEQRAELKVQVRAAENQLEEKRSIIRELEGEKLNLLMGAAMAEKEVAFLKERIHQSVSKAYSKISMILKEHTEGESMSGIAKIASSSGLGWPKEQDYSLKLASETHKLLSREELPWDDESEAFKDQPGSEISSSAMNDISISNIKAKFKEEVSLLNSELFVKGTQNNPKATLSQTLKSISDFVKTYCLKMEKLWGSYRQATRRQVRQLIERYKGLQEYNHQFERNQYSLLNHLEELQGGLESQLGIVAKQEQALAAANQTISTLEERIADNDQVIRDLEAAVAALQEERQQLKQQIHENNYLHAQRQEQLMLGISQGELSPVKDRSLSPRLKHPRKENKKYITERECDHERQIIAYKEQLKTLELQLSHERKSCKQLELALQTAEMERRKHQFAFKLRERMHNLNESIEISGQQSRSEEDSGSKGFQREQFAKVLAE